MDEEHAGASAADGADGTSDEPVEAEGDVAAAGRRLLSEDWAATILGLVLLVLVLAGVIGKGLVP
jgi:hypothetical protein